MTAARPDFRVTFFEPTHFHVRPLTRRCLNWLQEWVDGPWADGGMVVHPNAVDQLVKTMTEQFQFTPEP